MTVFFVSILVPSPTVIQGATGGLVAALIFSQLLDYKGSSLKSFGRYVNMLCVPLLIWFVFKMFIGIARIVTSM
ncbi:MAG: hypothetical protein JXA46_07180 [Dehalococcoidales bacterium]|nr:hypothetical protein [Dehalococcoidales bacterium]